MVTEDHRARDGAGVSSADPVPVLTGCTATKAEPFHTLSIGLAAVVSSHCLAFAVARLTASTRRCIWGGGANVNGADFHRVAIAVLKEQAR
jgi:hypothetical protein